MIKLNNILCRYVILFWLFIFSSILLAANGSLHVTSFPSGAEVIIDGVNTGRITPMTEPLSVGGHHTVEVSVPNGSGWNAEDQIIEIFQGNNTLHFILSPTLSQGPEGPRGDRGGAGVQGSVGPQGNIGATGPQGLTGPQGATGSQGDTGTVGPQGSTGAQGPSGPAGTSDQAFVFIGYTQAIVSGYSSYALKNYKCHEEYSNSRMCTTKELLQSSNASIIDGGTSAAWILPHFMATSLPEFIDFSGSSGSYIYKFMCNTYGETQSGMVIYRDAGAIGIIPCSFSLPVSCCRSRDF